MYISNLAIVFIAFICNHSSFAQHSSLSQNSLPVFSETLPSEPPLWELEFQWTLEFSKNNCRGQNALD